MSDTDNTTEVLNESIYSNNLTAGTYLLFQSVTAGTDGRYTNPALGDIAADSATSGWKKLCDIKDYPKFRETPEGIDNTTLSDFNHTEVPDIPGTQRKTFTVPWSNATMAKIRALEGTVTAFEVLGGRYQAGCFAGACRFCGEVFATQKEGAVGGLREIELTIYVRNTIEEDYTAPTT